MLFGDCANIYHKTLVDPTHHNGDIKSDANDLKFRFKT